ncbi:uncharacterized protein LOC126645806 isoform X2 [Myiozetetes cayanensis]|uniref:uncharacterized protein LOC126645806 isoform X2 n=1 Tax=Myiozetetes cayanensis TaxID=478635 RepID=UPI00215E2CC8|nr:uncharacterized protein LOC126645806 isoform X2 [Myiozetetes cayanensis]
MQTPDPSASLQCPQRAQGRPAALPAHPAELGVHRAPLGMHKSFGNAGARAWPSQGDRTEGALPVPRFPAKEGSGAGGGSDSQRCPWTHLGSLDANTNFPPSSVSSTPGCSGITSLTPGWDSVVCSCRSEEVLALIPREVPRAGPPQADRELCVRWDPSGEAEQLQTMDPLLPREQVGRKRSVTGTEGSSGRRIVQKSLEWGWILAGGTAGWFGSWAWQHCQQQGWLIDLQTRHFEGRCWGSSPSTLQWEGGSEIRELKKNPNCSSHEGGEGLEWISQRSCGCPIPGSVRDQVGQGLEQPGLVEGVPMAEGGTG